MNLSILMRGLVSLVAVAVLGGLLALWWPSASSPEPSDAVEDAETVSRSSRIELTPNESAVAGIQTMRVARETLQLTKTVPARFAYDERQHVAVRTATDGVLDDLFVKPGDVVNDRQPLAIVRSPAIGQARSEVLRRQAEFDLIEAKRVQMAEVHNGVTRLVDALREGNSPEVIQRQLRDETLGVYRGQLLAKYSQLQLATQLADAAAAAGAAISGRVLQERTSEKQQALAELEGAIEQAVFETDQALRGTASEADTARRNLSIARQELQMLLGIQAEQSDAVSISPNESSLTRVEIRSPIAGTVERISFSRSERVAGGDELFVIADTSRLWVKADIRGQDWEAMQVNPGHPVTVTTPAYPDDVMTARVYYVGREVDPATGAVPLVAEIANPDGKLRPGLFARVEIPVDSVSDVIAIPRSALTDLEGSTSVFVATAQGFEPVAVEIGASNSQQVEIRSGLEEGQQVVTDGVFILKSELLLEAEE